ncbi:MAG: hypothetical protein ACKO5R_10815 [Planctomycetaceae bacterium]
MPARDGQAPPVVAIAGAPFSPDILWGLERQPGVQRVTATAAGAQVTLAPGGAVAPLVAWLVAQGVALDEVRRLRPSLEEAFLGLVTDTPDAVGEGA